MKSKQIVYTLGYIALFCIALYFVFGLLKISGQGLSSMGFNRNVIEGFGGGSDKQQERYREKQEKKIEDANEKMEAMFGQFENDPLSASYINMDDVAGFDDFKENILRMVDIHLKIKKNMTLNMLLDQMKGKKGMDLNNKVIHAQIDSIDRLYKFKTFLQEHENVQV
jgi:hypothetical protein